MKRIKRLLIPAITFLALSTTACIESLLGPAPQVDHAAIFDQIWQQFDLHYSFFEYKNVNWDTIGTKYRPRALAATTDHEFLSEIGAMLKELKDVHVSITPSGTGSTDGYISTYDTITTYFNSSLIFQSYVPHAALTSAKHMQYGMAAPTVGYVRIASFAGSGWASEMDEAIDSIPNAKSLIVDVRNNNGGNVELAIRIAGRFAAKAHTYGWIRLRNGPLHSDFTDYMAETVTPLGAHRFHGLVYLLTNRRDFSSAEDFVLAMRTITKVTVVGDTTAGASGGPIPRELANGWDYEMSEWIEYLPSKKMFEGVGLAPDVYVAATQGTDKQLERAIGLASTP